MKCVNYILIIGGIKKLGHIIYFQSQTVSIKEIICDFLLDKINDFIYNTLKLNNS